MKERYSLKKASSLLTGVLCSGACAVFCGAGISCNSGIPIANPLKKILVDNLSLPHDLSHRVIDVEIPFELFIEHLRSAMLDITELLGIFQLGTPNLNHIVLARLARYHGLRLILTTNFDTLMERALGDAGVKFKVHYRQHDLKSFSLSEPGVWRCVEIRIFKCHCFGKQ